MNITDTIAPKVDQLTADHLIGRTLTVRITDVRLTASEQPCEIHYDGCNGLPYRPGKSMRRVLVHVWGDQVSQYVGRSMTLYRDDDVQFGGLKVGGVRISHMSHIDEPKTLALTAKKGSKKAHKVLPLEAPKPAPPAPPAQDEAMDWTRATVARIAGCHDREALEALTSEAEVIESRAKLEEHRPKLALRITAAITAALASFDDA